ncbi:TetR/AcrR family transcriptional regulator [Faecalicatena sp. AGMB00832]|uniref:TetR/AcrR family transcriptional regulator n=1 Tax=Faecalicatena faecalis TaxID=2726362 RepID=A0ABS6D485_9FIRM|nr:MULTISPECIES: TetR/AcrR family transcriptional regulator [Faecalicatena]MBU3875981.1 TetR/AcrR family transcriptional regulator [Faecalicatena faecalis]MCI6468211.1 TetR/AcrR family transcriptional regulator [Faecalicatena sp.]MDY5620466.1 TetR/AcrR family transcriptional regulator [Lachnospiraceae bacterium]
MPRFSDTEKERIRQKMMQEGERLFTTFGIKKVSIDEIVQATGIAKGSFYSFYTSKEHLYMDIAGSLQMKMWREMDEFLEENKLLPPRELCKQCFLWMFRKLESYPMLKQADSETAEYLYRKLPPEVIAAHTKDDSHELDQLQKYGVHFKCGIDIATKTLQTLAISFLNLQQDTAADQQTIMGIILDGVLKELISDESD